MTAMTQAPFPAVAKPDRVAAARGEPVGPTRPRPRHAQRQGPGDHAPYDLLIIGAVRPVWSRRGRRPRRAPGWR